MPNVSIITTYTLYVPIDAYTGNDTKLSMVFLTQVVDIIGSEYGVETLVGACVDTYPTNRMVLSFTKREDAMAFQSDWEKVAGRIEAEQAANQFGIDPDDIPF